MPKQIAELLQQDDDDRAEQVAEYGKRLSTFELMLDIFHNSHKEGTMHRFGMRIESDNFQKWKAIVCDVFIKAVLECDKETIIELAEAAAFFKDKIGDFTPADPVRLELIRIKRDRPPGLVRRFFTIRQIAERVYKNSGIVREHSVDGFSKLRRLCKEMGVQIKPSRKTTKG